MSLKDAFGPFAPDNVSAYARACRLLEELEKNKARFSLDRCLALVAQGASVETRNNYDQTCLIVAAKNGHVKVVEALLDRGAPIDRQDNGGNTPLHWAAHRGHAAVVATLLKRGANPDLRDRDGNTPLIRAIGRRDIPMIFSLLDGGASVHGENNQGQGPGYFLVKYDILHAFVDEVCRRDERARKKAAAQARAGEDGGAPEKKTRKTIELKFSL